MTDSFKFPEHPLSNKRDAFQDEEGKNPFADSPAPQASDDSPYAAPTADDEIPEPQEGDYQAVLVPRGRTIQSMAWLGFLGTVVGLLGTIARSMGPIDGLPGVQLVHMLPIALAGWGFSLGAWLTGQHDLRAMAVGAMRSGGERRTRRGYYIGLVMTLVGSLTLLGLLAFMIFNSVT